MEREDKREVMEGRDGRREEGGGGGKEAWEEEEEEIKGKSEG